MNSLSISFFPTQNHWRWMQIWTMMPCQCPIWSAAAAILGATLIACAGRAISSPGASVKERIDQRVRKDEEMQAEALCFGAQLICPMIETRLALVMRSQLGLIWEERVSVAAVEDSDWRRDWSKLRSRATLGVWLIRFALRLKLRTDQTMNSSPRGAARARWSIHETEPRPGVAEHFDCCSLEVATAAVLLWRECIAAVPDSPSALRCAAQCCEAEFDS